MCRYIAQCSEGEIAVKSRDLAREAFNEGIELSEKTLPATHPLHLGLILNYSVFMYDTEKDKSKAINLARSAFDEAIRNLDSIPEEYYKESTTVLQWMRDNLTVWNSDLRHSG
jgi:14-3-3 protein epsilon